MKADTLTKEVLEEAFDNSESVGEFFTYLGYSKDPNTRTKNSVRSKVSELLSIQDIYSEIRKRSSEKRLIYKECPVCSKEFSFIKRTDKKEQVTCSHACSNTYFRSGLNNPNFKGTNYRTICFHWHIKECVICGEENIVTVHHLDEDNTNDSPSNLVPLCPTHHQYIHSKFAYLVEKQVLDYIYNWKKENQSVG